MACALRKYGSRSTRSFLGAASACLLAAAFLLGGLGSGHAEPPAQSPGETIEGHLEG